MATEAPSGNNPSNGTERRKTRRLVLSVPVEVEWQISSGEAVKEPALARDLDVLGALLQMKDSPDLKICNHPDRCRCVQAGGKTIPGTGTQITVKNASSGDLVQGRVVRLTRSPNGKLVDVGIELLEPSETFWGLTFQLQRTSLRIREIESAFQSDLRDVDFRVRRGLREAVEHLQGVVAAVQQWQDLQAQGKNPYSVLEALNSARVERTAHLLRELTADIDAAELTSTTEEYVNLAKSVERLYDRMTRGPVMAREEK